MLGNVRAFFREWWNIALMKKKPEHVVAEKWDLKKSVLDFFKAFVIAYGIILVFFIFRYFFVMSSVSIPAEITLAGFLMQFLISLLILIIIQAIGLVFLIFLNIILYFVLNSFFHLSALVFGGKGKFDQTVSALFRMNAGIVGSIGIIVLFLAFLLAGVLMFISPMDLYHRQTIAQSIITSETVDWSKIGLAATIMFTAEEGAVFVLITSLISLLLMVYALVLNALILKAVHKLSSIKTVLAVFIAIIIFVLIFGFFSVLAGPFFPETTSTAPAGFFSLFTLP